MGITEKKIAQYKISVDREQSFFKKIEGNPHSKNIFFWIKKLTDIIDSVDLDDNQKNDLLIVIINEMKDYIGMNQSH